MDLPYELINHIFSFGCHWFLSSFRLVNKQCKENVDKMTEELTRFCLQYKQPISFRWNHPLYDITFSPNLRNKCIGLHFIHKIFDCTNNEKKNLYPIVSLYHILFNAFSLYQMEEMVYNRLEGLFDYTFQKCICHQTVCATCFTNYIAIFKTIFLSLRYYTKYFQKTPVNELLQERTILFNSKK